MDIWLNKAEARRKATGEIQSGYDRIKKQLEEHQVRAVILKNQACNGNLAFTMHLKAYFHTIFFCNARALYTL